MSGALWIPGANRTSAFYGNKYPNAAMPRIDKLLLHSTETTGLPGYSGGATAPTVTIDPWNKKIWQHFAINRPGRALGNPSSTPVSENKDNVFQVEVIGYSDKGLGRPRGRYLPDLPTSGLQFIADMLIFVRKEWPGKTTLPSTWPLYGISSYASMQAAHMTSSEYDGFNGILAHLHAPKPSTHGDVAINIKALKAMVDKGLAPAPPAPTKPSPAAPATPPATSTTTTEGPSMFLVQLAGSAPVYKSDGFRRIHVTKEQRDALLAAGVKLTVVKTAGALAAFGAEAQS